MNSQKILLILLIFGILLAIGGILYLDKVQNKTKTPFSFHTLLSSSPTPTGGIIMSMYRIGTDTIRITNDGFSPNSVTIAPGSRVVWINNSGANATVNSDNYPTNKLYLPLNLGMFPDKFSVSLVFEKSGTYTYHDQLHPERKGKVIVE